MTKSYHVRFLNNDINLPQSLRSAAAVDVFNTHGVPSAINAYVDRRLRKS